MEMLLDFLNQLGLGAGTGPFSDFWAVFKNGGFIFIIYVIVEGFAEVWKNNRQAIFASKTKWVFLAIDVPRDNEQSPKAVEQIFNHIWGIIKSPIFKEKWWDGYFQVGYSLELVSIEGYIQYIIRSTDKNRNIVEAAVYAQYPTAQITEIEDYTKDFKPDNFKEKGYDLWGAQLQELREDFYPIRTYPLFEHPVAKTIVDPMAALLEIFSRLGPGEQAWLQIAIRPVHDDTWQKNSAAAVKKILGTPTEAKKTSMIDQMIDLPGQAITNLADNFLISAKTEKKEQKLEVPSKMLYLSPGERQAVEAIETKALKTGFQTKIRYIYIAKKENMNKATGISGFFGAYKQFGWLNGFKPHNQASTIANYWFKGRRLLKKQKRILKQYKSRSLWSGVNAERGRFVLNIEELASLYHFPYKGVGPAAVKTVGAKRAEAPYILPVETFADKEKEEARVSKHNANMLKANSETNHFDVEIPPDNLPV